MKRWEPSSNSRCSARRRSTGTWKYVREHHPQTPISREINEDNIILERRRPKPTEKHSSSSVGDRGHRVVKQKLKRSENQRNRGQAKPNKPSADNQRPYPKVIIKKRTLSPDSAYKQYVDAASQKIESASLKCYCEGTRQNLNSKEDTHEPPNGLAVQTDISTLLQNEKRLNREISLLRRELDLRAVYENKAISDLKKKVEVLELQNSDLEGGMATLREENQKTATCRSRDTKNNKGSISQPEMDWRRVVQSGLGVTIRLESDHIAVPHFRTSMNELMSRVLTASKRLADCLVSRREHTSPSRTQATEELHTLISRSIGDEGDILRSRRSALRSLLFVFIRDRIFHSDLCTSLHYEGRLLRAYHKLILKGGPNSLARLQSTALRIMLDKDGEFKESFILAQAIELQLEITDLLSPYLDTRTFAEGRSKVDAELEMLFSQAIEFRLRAFPSPRTRYEIVHYKAGHEFDPAVMEARDEFGKTISVPNDGVKRFIRLCVHGLIFGHRVDKQLSEEEEMRSQCRPFLLEDDDRREHIKESHLVTEKAVVML